VAAGDAACGVRVTIVVINRHPLACKKYHEHGFFLTK
jgi:hypothetical protein